MSSPTLYDEVWGAVIDVIAHAVAAAKAVSRSEDASTAEGRAGLRAALSQMDVARQSVGIAQQAIDNALAAAPTTHHDHWDDLLMDDVLPKLQQQQQ